jgi:hypothetical protein
MLMTDISASYIAAFISVSIWKFNLKNEKMKNEKMKKWKIQEKSTIDIFKLN